MYIITSLIQTWIPLLFTYFSSFSTWSVCSSAFYQWGIKNNYFLFLSLTPVASCNQLGPGLF
jgi:hypothetical protein